jgi:hypothetical protein
MTDSVTSQRQAYEAAFSGKPETETKRARALAVALDVRKFEIELYWKRASYFWVFTGAALVGYLAALTGKDIDNRSQAMLLTSCVGLVFAFAWFLVNRASKFWQSNWEAHVDLLEDHENGPLYKTVLSDRLKWWDVSGAYKFSVSKVNQLLSFYVALMFAFLVANTAFTCYHLSRHPQLFPTACLLLTGLGIFMLWLKGKTDEHDRTVLQRFRKTSISD